MKIDGSGCERHWLAVERVGKHRGRAVVHSAFGGRRAVKGGEALSFVYSSGDSEKIFVVDLSGRPRRGVGRMLTAGVHG